MSHTIHYIDCRLVANESLTGDTRVTDGSQDTGLKPKWPTSGGKYCKLIIV